MSEELNSKIHYTKPSITELEEAYALDAVKNGWGEKCYDYINRFESAFCRHLGVKYAIATSSATGALHMGMAALGIGDGDEVILADINWVASVAPVIHLGAKPVFVDIKPDTWCLDPVQVERAITPKTKAIIAVHIYGNLCDMDCLRAIAQKYSLALIEDAAEAIGSIYHGNRAGSMGDFGVFSFHGTKTLTTGEGGIFVTNNADFYENVLTLSNHGRRRGESKQFWAEIVGFKYKISNIQAAIGCGQIERIDELIAGKRAVFERYQKALEGLPLIMNPEYSGTTNGYWMPTIVMDEAVKFDRELLLDEFKKNSIDGRVFFWPLSKLPMFKEKAENEVSYRTFKRAINLPSYHDLSEKQQSRVVALIRKSIGY